MLSIVTLALTIAATLGRVGHSKIELDFLTRAKAAPSGTRIVLIECGANDGTWSSAYHAFAEQMRSEGKPTEQVIIEPQPSFLKLLQKRASHMVNTTFYPAAAGKAEGMTSFYVDSKGNQSTSKGASLEQPTGGGGKELKVRTLDFAALLNDLLPTSKDTLSFLKLDVERFEYSLLPWLLTHGALCNVRFVLIEWHLNFVSIGRRLSALGLRLSFHSMLEEGCADPPIAVYHDDEHGNNWAVPVPGLFDVAIEHSLWAQKEVKGGVRPSSFTMASLRSDHATLRKIKYDDKLRSRGAEAVAEGEVDSDSQWPCPGRRTRAVACYGDCRYERMACNESLAAAAYEHALNVLPRVVPEYFDKHHLIYLNASDANPVRGNIHS